MYDIYMAYVLFFLVLYLNFDFLCYIFTTTIISLAMEILDECHTVKSTMISEDFRKICDKTLI
jgi:type IV secretory pathway TrbL component